MNSKMTTNSQLSTTELKKTKTKQTTSTGTESEKWASHRRFSVGRGREEEGGKVQRRRSIIGRRKLDRERPKMM